MIGWPWLLGVALALAIGLACRWLAIPVPAPPMLEGALLVVAMTAGYQGADRWLARRRARHEAACGGPSGQPHAPSGPSP